MNNTRILNGVVLGLLCIDIINVAFQATQVNITSNLAWLHLHNTILVIIIALCWYGAYRVEEEIEEWEIEAEIDRLKLESYVA